MPWKDKARKLKQQADYRAWRREVEKAKALGLPEPPKTYLKDPVTRPRVKPKPTPEADVTEASATPPVPKKTKERKETPPPPPVNPYILTLPDDLSPEDLSAIDALKAENAELMQRLARMRRLVGYLEMTAEHRPDRSITLDDFYALRTRFKSAEVIRGADWRDVKADVFGCREMVDLGEEGEGVECSDCTDEGTLQDHLEDPSGEP